MSDDDATGRLPIKGEDGPQSYPKLMCPYTGKKAHPRRVVTEMEDMDYIQYAAENEPAFLVSLQALDRKLGGGNGYVPLIRRSLAFLQEMI
jgi:hypothetical protein